MMIELLEYALSLERHRNFARAAKELGISQPTLTRGIQELERHFCAKLFDRTRQGVFPTAAGKILIDRSRIIARSFEELEKAINSFQGLQHAELKLGVGPVVAQTWAPDAVASLLEAHPQVEVHVKTHDFWELAPALLKQTIELAIGEVIPDIHKHSEIHVQPLPARPIRFFCRAGHPLTRLKNPTFGQIGQYPMAGPKLPLRASEHFGGTRALGKLSTNGMHFEPQVSCETFDVCLRIIKVSDNIGIAPLAQLSRISANAGFTLLPFDAPSLRTNYAIMRLRDRTLTPSATAFVEHALASEEAYHSINHEHEPKLKGQRRRTPAPSRQD
jgi:DNA-binding transcriptional LysR family regulator